MSVPLRLMSPGLNYTNLLCTVSMVLNLTLVFLIYSAMPNFPFSILRLSHSDVFLKLAKQLLTFYQVECWGQGVAIEAFSPSTSLF